VVRRLDPVPALLDKDTVYGGLVAAALAVAGRPHGEREGPWYDTNIKVYEYGSLTVTAAEIRSHGCPVLLCAPFTDHIHDPARWHMFVDALGGPPVHLVWVHTDAATLHARLTTRGLSRDGLKLAHFDEFVTAVRPGTPPAVPHLVVDNRLGAADQLADRVDSALGGLSAGFGSG